MIRSKHPAIVVAAALAALVAVGLPAAGAVATPVTRSPEFGCHTALRHANDGGRDLATLSAAAAVTTLVGQQAEFMPPDPHFGEQFGVSVAISGDTAVVGAPFKRPVSGAAYVFIRSSGTWSFQAKLVPRQRSPRDEFGLAVAISGDWIVVGAMFRGPGAAYVFHRVGDRWTEQAVLRADDIHGYNGAFGGSVAISGSTMLVGAPYWGKHTDTGAAYVFRRSGQTWREEAHIRDPDRDSGAQFGGAVALSGAAAAIGATGANEGRGAVYVFARAGGRWGREAKLAASDGQPGDWLGTSVAISGSTAVGGAYCRHGGHGAAYVFERVRGRWIQTARLMASDRHDYEFGIALALSRSALVIGADVSDPVSGAAYVLTRAASGWRLRTRLMPNDGQVADYFGFAVALSGSTIVVGACGHDFFSGTAYAFVVR